MKKYMLIIISIITFFICNYNVYATDNVYSVNKNKDEKFNYIIEGYNKKGKIDGIVAAGNYFKETIEIEENNYDDYQIMLVKYDNNGSIIWNYDYGNTSKDKIDCIEYTYNEENKIDGYLLVIPTTYDINSTEERQSNTTFIKVSLDGKQVFEKQAGINQKESIKKVVRTYNEENVFDGYIAIGSKKQDTEEDTAILAKYDRELNLIWYKEFRLENTDKTNFIDISNIYEEQKVVGYIVIRESFKENSKQTELIRYDREGNEVKNVDNTLNKYKSVNLAEANNGFILYGKTEDVKLKKGSITYYLINYNSNDEEEWETIGDTSIDEKGKIKIKAIIKEGLIKEYMILCTNKTNSSNQVIRIDNEGIIKNKIKKITNEYYDIEDFDIKNDVLYFAGQINCPEDDNCEYDSNSLFIVSDEDKVIEVEDKDSTGIIIFISIFISICIGTSFIKKKINKNI